MKYIRTEDENNLIIDMTNIQLPYHLTNEIVDFNKFGRFKIIKQANTIKELCDAFVITSKQGHIYDAYGDYGYELKEVLPEVRRECPDEDWDLYGCILIDGIIKQLAKANDKGELELL